MKLLLCVSQRHFACNPGCVVRSGGGRAAVPACGCLTARSSSCTPAALRYSLRVRPCGCRAVPLFHSPARPACRQSSPVPRPPCPAPPLRRPLQITVELKNDLAISGTLHSVDQYLNIKLNSIKVVNEQKYPHMLSVRNCFVRGSVVRYVHLPPGSVDVELLHDATRREARGG